jgi:hypothetical protein
VSARKISKSFTGKTPKKTQKQLIASTENSYASQFRSPSGPQENKQKNRPKKSVFLLPFANFSGKTGLKNSYAPRFPLLGIF